MSESVTGNLKSIYGELTLVPENRLYGIDIDFSRDSLFSTLGMQRMKDSYLRPDESSPQERFAYVASSFSSDQEHAQRLYDYASKHWLSFSTPILSYGRTKRGLPISCYLNYMEDSAEGLLENLSETNMLSMAGGGVGVHVQIRSADDKSVGVMPHMKIYDASVEAYRQGTTRRGSYAAYLDISHPDIEIFLDMRKPTGDPRLRCENLHQGINITDDFMHIIERCMLDASADDSWTLKDPDGKVHRTVSAKALWQKILATRMQTGEPYLHFIDTARKDAEVGPAKLHGSNLCAEIELPTGPDLTAVCCLSSLNLMYWDEWKDNNQFFLDVLRMLDNVCTVFTRDAPKSLWRAVNFVNDYRSVGVGVLGFHSLLQSKGIPWESPMAKGMNLRIFEQIRMELDMANKFLGLHLGHTKYASLNRFSHVMAIAPTASTSIILGNISPSIEPTRANVYRQDTLSGSHIHRNPLLEKLNILSEEDWKSCLQHDGSIQHLDHIDERIRDVFKTAMEIDQRWVVEFASDRAKYIDQGQSVNLFFPPSVDVAYLHACHFQAWKHGVKALYYCRSDKMRKADKIGQQIERIRIDMKSLAEGTDECLACQ